MTGQPRRPQDQGSVENADATVKRVLGSVFTERRLAGENPNWTEVLGSVASVLNLQSGRGKNDVSGFEAVFGQVYDHPLTCSKEEACHCWTIDDRMKVTSEPHFEDYVRETYHTRQDRGDYKQQKEEIDDSGYFPSDDLSVKGTEEVTDSYFYEHLFNSNDSKSPPEDLPTVDNDLKSQPEDLK